MKDFREFLTRGLQSIGIKPASLYTGEFELYYRELKRWSRAYNITGLRDEEEILTRLYLDSILYLKYIPSYGETLLDVGSGGGFPGLVIKIMRRDLGVTLLEPSRKRVAFLNHVSTMLKLKRLRIVQSTIEEFVKTQSNAEFDVITTKALFRAADLVRKSQRVLRSNGIVLLSKGRAYRDEVAEFEKDRRLSGAFTIEVSEETIPLTDIKRYFLIIRRKNVRSL